LSIIVAAAAIEDICVLFVAGRTGPADELVVIFAFGETVVAVLLSALLLSLVLFKLFVQFGIVLIQTVIVHSLHFVWKRGVRIRFTRTQVGWMFVVVFVEAP